MPVLQSRKYITLHLKTFLNHLHVYYVSMNIKFTFSKNPPPPPIFALKEKFKLDIFTSTLSPLNPQHTSDRMCPTNIQIYLRFNLTFSITNNNPTIGTRSISSKGQNFRSSVTTIISLRRHYHPRKGIRIYLKLN